MENMSTHLFLLILTLHFISKYGWIVVQCEIRSSGFTLQNRNNVEKQATMRGETPALPSENVTNCKLEACSVELSVGIF